jgi:hypothetical protein
MTHVEVEFPLRTVSAMNSREHWAARARAARDQRMTTRMALATRADWRPRGLCWVVTLTRVAPSKGLDGDNLQAALKHVRDGVADVLGIDDGSQDITWMYRQEQTPTRRGRNGGNCVIGHRYLVRVTISLR